MFIFCRLFTELGESFLERIISSNSPAHFHHAVKVFDLILMCVGHHHYEVAELTFTLWYVLSEELYQKNNKELTELFKPYIERLITALCRHCQMEPDCEGRHDTFDLLTGNYICRFFKGYWMTQMNSKIFEKKFRN